MPESPRYMIACQGHVASSVYRNIYVNLRIYTCMYTYAYTYACMYACTGVTGLPCAGCGNQTTATGSPPQAFANVHKYGRKYHIYIYIYTYM